MLVSRRSILAAISLAMVAPVSIIRGSVVEELDADSAYVYRRLHYWLETEKQPLELKYEQPPGSFNLLVTAGIPQSHGRLHCFIAVFSICLNVEGVIRKLKQTTTLNHRFFNNGTSTEAFTFIEAVDQRKAVALRSGLRGV